ncbi:MAG: bifunctional phosphoribosylaminoimidazolecarboxamide formyltransferase/IMP cyclohydrolase [Blastocatellia bacterium]|nr:bifunctional phosphoribosylaminoimidazolecarboxamide formyltransferase/IMP cyclohydrolase [Blastocatellia bacterium]
MTDLKKITRALISVSDKQGILELAQVLVRHNIEIISTGGTAKLLRAYGVNVRDVSDFTGFPEMLDGRVKTLHPKIHGGILHIRDNAEHRRHANNHNIAPIDLVIVNLYPFRETIAKPSVTLDDAIENIDIGGPAMLRSAAKNHNDVAVVVEPTDYPRLTKLLNANDGALPQTVRYELAVKAFRHTAAYDRDISRYLGQQLPTDATTNELPDEWTLELNKATGLRYGENPHQKAALYKIAGSNERGVANAEQLQGKELSYNNLLDGDAAWNLALEIYQAQRRDAQASGAIETSGLPHTCAIIKHTNPCGIGIGTTALDAFTKAKATDPVSAFGGIIACTKTIDESAAHAMSELFAEVIIAPDFTAEAKTIFSVKKNLRLLQMGEIATSRDPYFELRRISGGMLVQENDHELLDEESFKIVSERKPTVAELRALRFAWAICKHVKSNAIVYAKEDQLVGVGAGQMSRVDSVKLGATKAQLPLTGSVLASDAFFPFRDGLDEAARHGITAVIQPGGSVRDADAIQAANEHNLAMVFTAMRHFKH